MSTWTLVRSQPTVFVDRSSRTVGAISSDALLRFETDGHRGLGKRLFVPLFASPVAPAATSGPTTAAAATSAKATFANDMVMLRLRTLSEYEDMALNKWGIREPPLNYQDGTVREEGKSSELLSILSKD